MKITLDGMYRVECCDITADKEKGHKERFPLLKDGKLPPAYEFHSMSHLNFDGIITLYVSRRPEVPRPIKAGRKRTK